MSAPFPRNRPARRQDEGAYAILYAVLVVILVGVAAIVVDSASVRQDRRLNRSAADSAAIAAAEGLSPGNSGGQNPYAACTRAWAYLSTILNVGVPAQACDRFSTYNNDAAAVSNYCSATVAPFPDQIEDDRAISGGRVVRIAWPIPYHVGGPISDFLTPDLAPGSAQQTFDTTNDGSENGCDRMGVAIFDNETFGLGGALGIGGTQTQVHSVARYTVHPGTGTTIAALNILDLHTCQSLYASGQGAIRVFPDTAGGGGVISVESDGTTNCGGAKYVIDASNNASAIICALGPGENASHCATTLGGIIQSHALDPGGVAAKAYSPGKPKPTPTPEGGVYGWTPVTDEFGCVSMTSAAPQPVRSCPTNRTPVPNYIKLLDNAYGSGTPTTPYNPVGAAYQPAPYGNFQTLNNGSPIPGGVGNFSCSPSADMYVPPGNWFVNCASFTAGANDVNIVFGGGHAVFNGNIDIARQGACFAFNSPIGSAGACPTVVNSGTQQATTSTRPSRDGLIVVRGSGITTGSNNTSILMPQTFVYQRSGGSFGIGGGGGTILWTAPAAGELIGGTSRLDLDCTSGTPPVLNTDCKESRFSKLLYYNESSSGSSYIKGQAGFNLVGVFFDPRQDFEIAGQGSGQVDASAQFWVNTLNNSGQGALNMLPDPALSVPKPFYTFSLIR